MEFRVDCVVSDNMFVLFTMKDTDSKFALDLKFRIVSLQHQLLDGRTDSLFRFTGALNRGRIDCDSLEVFKGIQGRPALLPQ